MPLLVIALVLAQRAPELLPRPSPPPLFEADPPRPHAEPPPRTERAPNPQRERAAPGSVRGAWAYAQSGFRLATGTFFGPQVPAAGGVESLVVRGWGLQRDGVRLVPSVSVAWATVETSTGRQDAALATVRLAAPEVLFERLSRLRLTPFLGVALGVADQVPVTTSSLGLQLERRFGPIEAAYRAEASGLSPISGDLVTDRWQLLNRFFVEGWILPHVSAALGLDLVSRWRNGSSGMIQSDLFVTTVQLNFTLLEHVGFTFSMDTTTPTVDAAGAPVWFPFYAFNREAQNLTSFALRVWARTDGRLQRNWLDR
ncbi:MAG: hypothetical protein JNK82_01710 [Myxococcaceae bacterium]|nr:hypothetical protein [Myxococcaceae bacterium]